MIELRDKDKNRVAGLVDYENLCIESVLESGDKTLSFYYPKKGKYYDEIVEEAYIRTKRDEFVVKARELDEDYTKFECSLNLEELEGNIFDRFESVEQTITSALNLAVVGTGWTVKDNTLKKRRTVRCTNKSSLEIVREIKKVYRVDIVFNTLGKQIEVYEHLGEDKGTYFIDSLNLIALQVQSDSRQYATRIIAEGKDGLSFSDINNGKNYVENYQYSNKVKTIYWKDERYTIKENLLEDAMAKLEELSKPFRSYSASILNLAELNPRYSSILDFKLGDAINLISKKNKIKDKTRIVKTIEYPQDHSRDAVELANATLKFEDIQQENQETTDTVNNITTDNGTVDGSTIDSIQVKQIEDFKANVIEVVNLKAINASIENLHANKADIQDLHAVNAKIGTLEATKANITELNAVSAEIQQLNSIKANIVDLNSATAKIGVLEAKTASIDNLLSQKASINDLNALNATISEALIKKATIAQLEALETKTNKLIADKANIKDLNVANANINKIQAETANIKTLLNGNLSSENIQAGGITSDKLTIANGFITNLMISSVSASKITAGTIDAAKINVVNLNADNLTVGKINGQLLKDGSISGLAIENGAIDNNKVSPNANIEASKINISSVVTAINEGSTLLTANKVTIDSEKGTLDVAFNNLNTSLEANKKITESNSTAINVVQGKLSASIENSKVLESKQKTLEDNYNRTVITVDSLKNTVGQQKTLIDSATGKITSVEVKANTLEKNLSGLTQTVTDTKKVIENNKTVLESKNAELKANIDSVSSSLSSVSSTVDKNNKTLVAKTNTLEQNLNGLTQRVESNKTVTDGKITSVENEAHELKAGLGGLTSKLDTLKSTTDGINKTVSNQGSVINQLKDSINLKVDSSTFTQSTQTINNNIARAKEQAIIGARSIPDTRGNNESPGWYMQHYAFQTITEFKYANVIGVPNGGSWFGTLETTVPWNNSSGGYPTQVFRSNSSPVYQRHGTDLNTWSSWEQIEDTQGSQAKANNALNNAKSYSDSKKQEAIKAAENLALEKSNLAKKYADEVATAKANLAQANAIANADGKITEEERKRIQQAQENLNTAISKANEALNNAKAYTNTEITTVNTHLNKATSEINVLKGQISSKVSQSDVDNTVIKYKTQNYGYLYKKDIVIYGDYNLYYPVVIKGGDQNVKRKIFIKRGYGEQGPSEWNPSLSTHHGGLSLLINTNFGGWGGINYSWSIYDLEEQYSRMFAGATLCASGMAFAIFLRGGGEKGAIYHLYSDQSLEGSFGWEKEDVPKPPALQIAYNKDMISFYKPAYEFYAPGPRTITKEVEEEIKRKKFIELAQSNKNEIIETNKKITTVESTLTQENNSIKASVRDLNSTTQSITTNVSNINRDLTNKINSNLDAAKSFATDIATNKANTAKQEAINSANSIAASKANEALNNAKSYTNTEINVVNTKVHNVESNIDILKNKIALKVEQSDIDKTKTELINKINVVDNLANNAKDLASAMSLGKMLFSDPTFKNSSNNIKTYNNNGNGTVTTSRISKINGCPTDSQYCIEVKTVGSASPNHGGFYFGNMTRANAIFVTKIIAKIPVGLRIGWYSNSTGNNGSSKWLTSVNGTGKWEEYIHLLKCGDTGNFSSTSFFALDGGITPSTSNPIVWHLAYATVFDITENDESVNVLKTEMSTAKNKVATIETNLDNITQRVSSTESKTHSIETTLGGKASKQEVAEVNNRVATIKASLDGITQRVSATESKTQTLESNLNGKASKQEVNNVSSKVVSLEANLSGITNRVSNTESRINSVDGKVNNATTRQEFTEFKQGYDNFKLDVSKNFGSKNLIRNSGFLYGYNYFYPMIYEFDGHLDLAVWTDSSEWVISDTCALTIRGGNFNRGCCGARQEGIKLKPNTKYTIAFSAAAHRCKWRLSLNTNGWGQLVWTEGNSTGGKDPNNWDNRSITFVTGPSASEITNCKLDLVMQNRNANDPYAWFTNLILVEGEFAPKWTPMSGESYSNTVIIDQDKVKTMFENGTYAQMGRDGFEWYNSGTGHSYHALAYVTSLGIPAGNPGRAYVRLPVEFTKRRKSLKWTVALRGYYYSTSGDFFPMHVHVSGTEEYEENGILVCPIEGYCKIQNAQNSGDIQFRPVTAMLIAVA